MKSTVKIAVAFFAYGGNGGVASLVPELALWWGRVYHKLCQDQRVELVFPAIYSDTPVYMTRNRAVRDALESGYDMLLMLDSDNEPDAYVGKDPAAEPFFGKPFDFVFERLKQGIPTVMMAPYCGPPPHPVPRSGVTDEGEVPYLFQWTNRESDTADANWSQRMMTRNEAERLSGIFPVSCGPTGVSLWTLNVFDGPPRPYFDYEHDHDKTQKLGTEDCYATRNVSLYWKIAKNYDVCYAACDSWALHHKTKRVGKPRCATLEIVAESMRSAILQGHSSQETLQYVDYDRLPRRGQVLGPDDNQVVLTEADMEHARQLIELEQQQEPHASHIMSLARKIDAELSGPPSNGSLPIRTQTLGGKRVTCYRGQEAFDQDTINHLESLLNWFRYSRVNAPAEAAVVHSGTGQGAALVNGLLPEGSHLYCLDNLGSQEHGSQMAEWFADVFRTELEEGRVLADVQGRAFPMPISQQSLDFVLIERFVTEELIVEWLPHLAPRGLLCGIGNYPAAQRAASLRGLPSSERGCVWAIPLGERNVQIQLPEAFY